VQHGIIPAQASRRFGTARATRPHAAVPSDEMRRVAALVLLLAAVAVVLVRGRDEPQATTLGRAERVRYIGVDTPESVKPGTPVQCFAKRAAAANAALVAGREVRLVGDVERRDRYGRLLAYVYREPDGAFVNAELVRDGYARTLTIAPNVAHSRQLSELARAARESGRGLWAACGME
jgi:micrococcal nuclease